MHRCRAFSLIEAVVVVIVLGLAVPPALSWLDSAVSARADAVNATRATVLATSVMESILADSASTAPGLGFAAFADESAYLNNPASGLRTRLVALTEPYEASGLAYAVTIGPLTAFDGVASGDSSRDVFRLITVTVTFPSAAGGTLELPVSAWTSEMP